MAKAAVPKLTKNLQDDDIDVRWNSCKALAAIGAPAASAIPALQKLADEKPEATPKSKFKSDFEYNKDGIGRGDRGDRGDQGRPGQP